MLLISPAPGRRFAGRLFHRVSRGRQAILWGWARLAPPARTSGSGSPDWAGIGDASMWAAANGVGPGMDDRGWVNAFRNAAPGSSGGSLERVLGGRENFLPGQGRLDPFCAGRGCAVWLQRTRLGHRGRPSRADIGGRALLIKPGLARVCGLSGPNSIPAEVTRNWSTSETTEDSYYFRTPP